MASLIALAAFGLGIALRPSAMGETWLFPAQSTWLGAPAPRLVFDSFTWPWASLALSLVATVLLTASTYAVAYPSAWPWASVLTLGGIVLLGALAANLLTLLMMWVLLDAVALVFALRFLEEEARRSQAVALAWARSLAWLGPLGALLVPDKEVAGQALLLAVLWRLLWQPWEVVGEQRHASLWPAAIVLRRGQVLLTLAALRFWPAHVVENSTALGAGVFVLSFLSAWAWVVQPSPAAGDSLALALGGWAGLAAALGVPEAAVGLATLALLLGLLADVDWYGGWMTWPAWGGALASLALLPQTPGALIQAFWDALGTALQGGLGVTWFLVAVGAWRRLTWPPHGERRADQPVGAYGTYLLGVLLPLGAALRWSLLSKAASVVLWPGIALLLAGGLLLGWHRLKRAARGGPDLQALLARGSRRGRQALGRLLWSLYYRIRQGLAFLTGLMEGEGGVLWAVVLLGWLVIWMKWGRP